MSEDLIVSVENRIATLTMNRPDRRNALSGAMMDGFLDALPRFAEDPEIGVVVVSGMGRAFCAGGDVKAMAERKEVDPNASLESNVQSLRARMELSRWLHQMPKPTIAMIPGPAAGAGLSIALACDIRIASDNAKFTTAFANVGYSGDFGGSYFLSHLVGTAKARELYYTAEILTAEQAFALGMLNKVVPEAELEAATDALAKKIANGPSVAHRYMKRNMNAALSQPLEFCFDLEAMHHTRTGQTEDHIEAAKAFVEKRAPVFKGR